MAGSFTQDEKMELEHDELAKNSNDVSPPPVYNVGEVKRILRKVDKRLLPVLALLYLLSFLDRGNSKSSRKDSPDNSALIQLQLGMLEPWECKRT